MYRNSYQRGMLTVFFSVGSKPLAIWETHTKDGYISRFLDPDIKSMVLEIRGTNVSTTYMTCPKGNMVLGITMPFLVMIVKNLRKYFTFEVTILDETGTRRRFRVANFQSNTQILPLCTVMPIGLSEGWNQIQFNLAEFTRRAYKKQFVEVQKLKINANIRLRRIYFAERLIPEDELPAEYRLYFPLATKNGGSAKKAFKDEEKNKDNCKPSTSQSAVAAPISENPAKEKRDSKLEIIKPPSKTTSIHSVRKSESHESKRVSIGGTGQAIEKFTPTASVAGIPNVNEAEAPLVEGEHEKSHESTRVSIVSKEQALEKLNPTTSVVGIPKVNGTEAPLAEDEHEAPATIVPESEAYEVVEKSEEVADVSIQIGEN